MKFKLHIQKTTSKKKGMNIKRSFMVCIGLFVETLTWCRRRLRLWIKIWWFSCDHLWKDQHMIPNYNHISFYTEIYDIYSTFLHHTHKCNICIYNYLSTTIYYTYQQFPTHYRWKHSRKHHPFPIRRPQCVYCNLTWWYGAFICTGGVKSLRCVMVIPPLMGNPYNRYVNPYYKVDDHPYHRKTMRIETQAHYDYQYGLHCNSLDTWPG